MDSSLNYYDCLFFNDTATTYSYTDGHLLSLPAALPISFAERCPDIARTEAMGGDPRFGDLERNGLRQPRESVLGGDIGRFERRGDERVRRSGADEDRKSTRQNSSH